MKYLLQGKFMGHPLHPMLVHFPISLFFITVALDIISLIDPGETWVKAAFWSLAFGVGLALITAVPGLVDFLDIRRDHPARRIAVMHMTLNLIAVALYIGSLGFRAATLDAARTPWIPLGISLVAFGIIGYSGHLGGKMVYDNGVGVGRHRRLTSTPQETIRAARLAEDWYSVCPAEELEEGSSRRVQLDGQVIVVVRQEEQVFAFQEFCTHRWGPLSEGKYFDGQVECPWHRSCFDMRTGKVTQGPAKQEIKTFPVAVRDGQIAVQLRR